MVYQHTQANNIRILVWLHLTVKEMEVKNWANFRNFLRTNKKSSKADSSISEKIESPRSNVQGLDYSRPILEEEHRREDGRMQHLATKEVRRLGIEPSTSAWKALMITNSPPARFAAVLAAT